MTGPAAPPLPAELDALVRRMRLPYLRKAAPDVLATARAQRWEPAEVLRVLLTEEVAGRDAATRRMRRKTAAFPSGKTFSSWRAGESSIPAATQDALATLEWIGRAENLVIAGPSGTGKSHLVEALAHAAVEREDPVAWFTLEQVGALVRRHRADDSVTKAIARILRADLVVVDLCRHRTMPSSITWPASLRWKQERCVRHSSDAAKLLAAGAGRSRQGGRDGEFTQESGRSEPAR